MKDADVDVVIVIVTHCSAADIVTCLESVEAHTSVTARVVVVDNASDDGTADLVAERFPEVDLVRSERNLGFAGGVNLGAGRHRGRYLLLLNPDTELRGPAIDRLVRVADRHPDHRIYGGRVVHRDTGREGLSAWRLPSLWSLTCFALGLNRAFARTRLFDPTIITGVPRHGTLEVGGVSGCLQLIDTTLWQELDGFDDTYFMYGEDVDWAIRARTAGARPVLVGEAEIHHEIGGSSTSVAKRVMVLTGTATVLRRRWSPLRAWLGLRLMWLGTAVRGPVANTIRRVTRREPDETWAAAWRERRAWSQGW